MSKLRMRDLPACSWCASGPDRESPPLPHASHPSKLAPSRQGKWSKTIYVKPAAVCQLKRIAADEDTNVETLIREVFQARGLPEIAG